VEADQEPRRERRGVDTGVPDDRVDVLPYEVAVGAVGGQPHGEDCAERCRAERATDQPAERRA
jgi:hypothetical protein